jgi:beta-phosphoglucomutase-like phosphatase (HAD superfamily)
LDVQVLTLSGLMIKAVIFDLDGVIAETEHIHIQAEKQTMLKYGVKVSEDELHQYTGTTAKQMFRVNPKIQAQHNFRQDIQRERRNSVQTA